MAAEPIVIPVPVITPLEVTAPELIVPTPDILLLVSAIVIPVDWRPLPVPSDLISLLSVPKALSAATEFPPPPTFDSTSASFRNVTRSEIATCFIVPASFVTKRSAATRVVDVALVSPSIMFISAVVAVTPSIIESSAVDANIPSSTFNSLVERVAPSRMLSSAVVEVMFARTFSSLVVVVKPSNTFISPVERVAPSRMLSSAAVEVIEVLPILKGVGIVTVPVKVGPELETFAFS